MNQAFYTDSQQRQVLRIIPDLIRGRALLRDLVSKELRARYRNAMMGLLWAVLQPVLMMAILTFVFGYVLNFVGGRSSGSQHSYAVFLLCGLVPWQFLSISLTSSAASLVTSQELIKKVYFPREVIPLAAILNCVINVIIGFVTLFVVMVLLEGFGALGAGILWLPFIFAIQFALVVGLGLLFSALNVFYQDVGYMIDVGLAFGFYATPVFYDVPANILSPWLYRLYMLNPMAHLVTAYRQALLDNRFPDLIHLAWPALAAGLVIALGVCVFRRNAPFFADYF